MRYYFFFATSQLHGKEGTDQKPLASKDGQIKDDQSYNHSIFRLLLYCCSSFINWSSNGRLRYDRGIHSRTSNNTNFNLVR